MPARGGEEAKASELFRGRAGQDEFKKEGGRRMYGINNN